MQDPRIEKLVEETISSLDGAARAEANPFLLTRIFARVQQQAGGQNIWSSLASFLSKPVVALGGLALILSINAVIIFSNTKDNRASQNVAPSKDEFAINVISIYDTENQEP